MPERVNATYGGSEFVAGPQGAAPLGGFSFDASGNPIVIDIAGVSQITVTTSGVASGTFNVTDYNATKDTTNPCYTFVGDTDTGIGSAGANQLQIIAGGTATISTTATAVTVTGTLAVTGNSTITGTFGVTGATTVTGSLHVTTTAAIDGVLTTPGALSAAGAPYMYSTSTTPVEYWMETATITSAGAGTAVHILPAARVTGARKFYLLGYVLNVGGATAWATTGTVLKLQDTAGSPVVFSTIAVAGLTGNATLMQSSANTTLAAPFFNQAGSTAAKGLDIIGDANFGAGSTITVSAWGIIR